jgi:DNA-binding transcriptional regulator YiaG
MKGKLTTCTLKVTNKPKVGKTDLCRIKKMNEAELEANALKDEDNLPLTKKQLMKFKPVYPAKKVDVKAIREKLKLSQEKFAQYFGVSVRTLQDWEQHRHEPSHTARNFLLVVAKEPQAVQRALK